MPGDRRLVERKSEGEIAVLRRAYVAVQLDLLSFLDSFPEDLHFTVGQKSGAPNDQLTQVVPMEGFLPLVICTNDNLVHHGCEGTKCVNFANVFVPGCIIEPLRKESLHREHVY